MFERERTIVKYTGCIANFIIYLTLTTTWTLETKIFYREKTGKPTTKNQTLNTSQKLQFLTPNFVILPVVVVLNDCGKLK